MNKIVILYAALFLFIGPNTAFSAQRGGTVTITGCVSPSLNIRLVETRPMGEISATGVFTETGLLSLTMDFTDSGPPSNNSPVGAVVTFALRGNTDYQLSATATAGDFVRVSPQKVGFGVGNIRASGSDVMPGAVSGARIAPKFAANPFYDESSTLVDILARKIKLISGTRISRRGTWNTPGNALLVDTYYAIAPKFFDAPVVINITFTISVP